MDVVVRNHLRLTGRSDGPTLVFAHGFGCDQGMWRDVAPAFQSTHRVVTFDHVGAGASDLTAYDASRHATLHGYAQDVVDILQSLGRGPVTFVGHSVSAMIGVLVAVDHPEWLAELVMVCPNPRYVDDTGYRGGFTRSEIDELLETMDENYLGWSASIAPVIMGVPDREELGAELTRSFCRSDPAIARTFARATFLADNRADLQRVAVPTLVLQCRDDVIAPPEVGAYVHEQVRGSRLVTLDATGHCPNLSAPGELVRALTAHLGE